MTQTAMKWHKNL